MVKPSCLQCFFLVVGVQSVRFTGSSGLDLGFSGSSDLDSGANRDSWVCACRMANGTSHVFDNNARCNELSAYAAGDERQGNTCIRRKDAHQICTDQMTEWFSDYIGVAPFPDAAKKLSEQLRNEALLPILQQVAANGASFWHSNVLLTPELFANYTSGLCTEVAIKKFMGGQMTGLYGRGILTDVFGWYPTQYEAITPRFEGSEIQVGGVGARIEHPLFKKIRSSFGVPDDFLADADLSKIDNSIEAGSGSIFVRHGAFLIKGERLHDWHSQVDWRSMHIIIGDYAEKIMNDQNTMLPRFFTAFYDPEAKIYWFVMQNWVESTWTDSVRLYDFKGSLIPVKRGDTNNRLVQLTAKWDSKRIAKKTLKDMNFFGQKVHIPKDIRDTVVKQLAVDAEWLKERHLMDYSFVLQVIHVGDHDNNTFQTLCKKGGAPVPHRGVGQRDNGFVAGVVTDDSTMYVYSFGLIDVLQPYSVMKAVGTAYDKLTFPAQTGELAMNNIPPKEYGTRFAQFIDDIVVGDAEPLRCPK